MPSLSNASQPRSEPGGLAGASEVLPAKLLDWEIITLRWSEGHRCLWLAPGGTGEGGPQPGPWAVCCCPPAGGGTQGSGAPL